MCTIPDETGQAARPRAYILGPPSCTRTLSREMEALGFATIAVEERVEIPTISELDSVEKMKKALAHAIRLSANENSQGADGAALGLTPHYLHPGVSRWGERAELPVIAQELGLTTVAPSAFTLALFSNKLNLLSEAERLGIPNLVLSFDPLHGVREVEKFLIQSRLSFPVVLRSVHSAGYFGKYVVRDYDDFERKLGLWIEQLNRNTGEDLVFAESHLDGSRQISVPFARSRSGEITFFPSIDCSLQSSCRKIIEICPAQQVAGGLDPEVEFKIKKWTEMLLIHSRFTGIGSLEFLVDGNKAFLTDGKGRLASSFHLWERVSGQSAVQWQLAIMSQNGTVPIYNRAAGKPSAVAVHLLAEDSLLQLPQSGYIAEVSPQRHWEYPGCDADLWLDIEAGTELSTPQHGKLGTLFVGGQDLQQTLSIARGILLNDVWIAGALQTNERFVSELLEHPWVRAGIFHTEFVDQEFTPRLRPEWVNLFASICAAHPDVLKNLTPGIRWIAGDQWAKASPESIQWIGQPRFFRKALGFPGVCGRIQLPDGQQVNVCAYPIAPIALRRWQARIGQWVLNTKLVLPQVSGDKKIPRLLALVPGRIHSLLFRPGSVVGAHETSLIIESLGYLVPHASPRDFRILHWKVEPDQIVCSGQELADIEFTELQE